MSSLLKVHSAPCNKIPPYGLDWMNAKKRKKKNSSHPSLHKPHKIYGRNLKSSILFVCFFFVSIFFLFGVCCFCKMKRKAKRKKNRIDTGSIRCYHICTWDLLKISMLTTMVNWKEGKKRVFSSYSEEKKAYDEEIKASILFI